MILACVALVERRINSADRGLADATQRAADAVHGLLDDGPVKIANTEIAALTEQAEHAEQRAALWRQATEALTVSHARQRDEHDQARKASDTAARQVAGVRAEVADPLTEQASAALDECGASHPGGTKTVRRGSSASPGPGSPRLDNF